MRHLFFIFLFFIFFSSALVSATLNLDKGKLYFDLKTGEESCQDIIITAQNYTEAISVRNVWANNMSEDQNLNHYTTNPSDLGIAINYPKIFDSISEKQTVKVCINASAPGAYKGAIIFTPKSNTNIVVEVGSWLFLNVTGDQIETNKEVEQNQTTINTNSVPITGNVVGNNNSMRNILIIVVVLAVIVITALILTIRRWKRKYYYGY